MSKTACGLVLVAIGIFIVSQQLVVRDYEQLNDRLDAALSACAGIKKTK